MVATDSAKPMLLTSVSTLPTSARGALVAVRALNCGESPETVAPHSSSHGAQSHSGASSNHGASSAQAPLQASCAPPTRALPAPPEPPKRCASNPPPTQLSSPTAIAANTHHDAAAPCQRMPTMAGSSTKNAYSSHMWPK